MIIDKIYHVGHLAVDRAIRDYDDDDEDGDGPLTAEAAKLDERASRLMRAAEQGKVILYQRRCAQGFEYHMVAIRGA